MEELELCGQGETRCELLYLNVRIVIWQGSGQQGVLCLRLGGGRVVQMLALVLDSKERKCAGRLGAVRWRSGTETRLAR